MKRQNLLLILAALAIAILPLLTVRPPAGAGADAEIFTGSDGQAGTLITGIRPDYKPWFAPLWEPPSGEIESLLFGLQAALGAGLIGYCLGFHRGRALNAKP